MKALKYIGQILSALIYSPIYTGIMYYVIVIPFVWVVSLPFWKMILAFLFLGSIVEGIILVMQSFGAYPFSWIVKDNKVSLCISVLLCILFPLWNIYTLWKILLEHGTMGIVTAIILSGLLLQFVFGTVLALVEFSEKD